MIRRPNQQPNPEIHKEVESASASNLPKSTALNGLDAYIRSRAELEHANLGLDLLPEVANWALPQIQDGLDRFSGYYDRHYSTEPPRTIEELSQQTIDLAGSIERLYDARESLKEHIDPYVLEVVPVPWEDIQDGLFDHERVYQAAFNQDLPLYRAQIHPHRVETVDEYCGSMWAKYGKWGLMLMQTRHADISFGQSVKPEGSSIEELTSFGTEHIKLANQEVDMAGILEARSLMITKNIGQSNFDLYGMRLRRKSQPTQIYYGEVHTIFLEASGDFKISGSSQRRIYQHSERTPPLTICVAPKNE